MATDMNTFNCRLSGSKKEIQYKTIEAEKTKIKPLFGTNT